MFFKQARLSAVSIFLILLALTSLGALIIFPDYVLFHRVQFINSDFAIGYYGSFTLINFFQQGIGLWNVFDQLPMAFHLLTIGIFNVFHLLVAFVYLPLSLLSTEPAKLFADVYGSVFLISCIYVRVLGCYLLFSRFVNNQWLLIAVSLMGGFFYNIQFFMSGLSYGAYVPLLIHLTLNIFEQPRMQSLVLWFGMMSVCVLHSLIHAVYLYTGVHFLVLISTLAFLIRHRSLKMFAQDCSRSGRVIAVFSGVTFLTIGTLFIIFWKDIDFGQVTRISGFFNLSEFLKQHFAVAFGNEFFCRLVDFSDNHPWRFLGCGVVFLSIVGMVCSKNVYRLLFLAMIASVWMINSQPADSSVSLVIHSLHAVTNPFSSIVRNFQEFNMHFLPIWFLGLALMGLHVLINYKQELTTKNVTIVTVLILVFCVCVIPMLDMKYRVYLVIQAVLFASILCVLIVVRGGSQRLLCMIGTIIFCIIEGIVLINYVRFGMAIHTRPSIIATSNGMQLAGLDYQNPLVFPWRNSYDMAEHSEGVGKRLAYMNGLFLRHYSFGHYLNTPEEVFPRHRSFKGFEQDPSMRTYLNHHYPMVMFTPSTQTMTQTQFVSARIKSSQFAVMSDWIENKAIVQVPLNTSMGAPLTSTIFGKDSQDIQVFVVENESTQTYRPLKPVQGWLVENNSFDLGNIRTDHLTMAFNLADYPINKDIIVAVNDHTRRGLMRIYQWSNDQLTYTFKAPHEGMIITHFPYDPKWSIKVDGKSVVYKQVNKGFIGFNISAGEHLIEQRYLPYNPLRGLLWISFIGAMGMLGFICYTQVSRVQQHMHTQTTI